ncbi:MAG TPA: dienelactone hydrolase family protein [Beijerinckiaceae bacterium]|jgi:carboxymethylenebutenolidase|nr:dienelactone hydrolase family protein [Beijerinckiaceae bacterium]
MNDLTSNITTREIVCEGGLPAFIAHPKGGGKHPVFMLMHERYGLVQHTRDQAMRCARDGFYAVAANYFYKHPDLKVLNAGDSRYDLTDPESVTYNKAILAAIASDPAADSSKVAVGGYCQTGRHPLVFAAEVPIAAAVVWYGAASKREWTTNELFPRPLEEVIAAVPCPVFGAFGSRDHIISVADVRRLRDALEKHGKSFDIHIYAGAPHGWLNDTMPGRYRQAQAEAGWADQQGFLKRVLVDGGGAGDLFQSYSADIERDYDFSKNVRLE